MAPAPVVQQPEHLTPLINDHAPTPRPDDRTGYFRNSPNLSQSGPANFSLLTVIPAIENCLAVAPSIATDSEEATIHSDHIVGYPDMILTPGSSDGAFL